MNDFDDLEALLGEAKAAEREAREAKEARERAKRGGLTPSQRAEDEARLRDWEARHEWRDVANVALFERHRCACGRQQPIARAHDIAALQHQVLAIGNDHADEDVQRGCVCLLRPDRSWQQQADRAEPDQDAQASIAGRSGFT